jgi:predicted nucleic acid-binding protein
MFLLDTDVLSASRRPHKAHAGLSAWIAATPPTDMALSVVTILELEQGTRLVARRDQHQAAQLTRWLHDRVVPSFSDRILPFDIRAALRCATLHVPDPRPERDAMIAATAMVHGLILVTRNTRDFEPMGVKLLNPWTTP